MIQLDGYKETRQKELLEAVGLYNNETGLSRQQRCNFFIQLQDMKK